MGKIKGGIGNMTQIEFSERYIAGNEGDIEDAEVQKLWVEYGFTNILIESIDIITDKDVVNKIFTSDIWKSKKYILKEGKINNIRKLDKEIVEHLYEVISKYNSDIAIEDLTPFYEGTEPDTSYNEKKKDLVFNSNDALIKMFYQKDFDTCACSKLYNKKLFESIRYPKGWLYEDLSTTYRLIQRCNKVAFSYFKDYYYLLRCNSIEGSPFNPKKYESCMNIITQLERDRKDMSSEVQKALDCRIVSFAFHILAETPTKYIDIRKSLFDIIKLKRKRVLFDMKARKKTRIACMLTYIGLWSIDFFYNFGKSR